MDHKEISERFETGKLGNEYVIVSFLEKTPPSSFHQPDWPLHVTIVRPFFSNQTCDELVNAISVVCAQNQCVNTVGKSKEMFGPNKDVVVTELENTNALQSLHKQVVQVLGTEIVPSGPSFNEYRPHATKQKTGSILVGQNVIIDSMSLIRMSNDERQILSTIELK